MTITLETALELHDMELSVLPATSTKAPKLKGWNKYQQRRPTSGQIRNWFGDEDQDAIAIVLGKASQGGLACRDFDDPSGYQAWAAEHQTLARTLPTAITPRGFHVYAATDIDLAHKLMGATIKDLGDGELRAGGVCIAPPSKHPSGSLYRWQTPITADVATVDIIEAGFLPCNREHRVDRGEQSQLKPLRGVSVTLLHDDVEMAIARTLPTTKGQRNRQLFKFARELKALQNFADLPLPKLKPIVRQWYEAAKPMIGTHCFDTTWFDFGRSWDNAKVPLGREPIVILFEQAKAASLPAAALQYDSPDVRLLVSLCRQLQCAAGDGPFYLDARTAGKLLCVEHTTAWRWLNGLCRDGVLVLVKAGSKAERKASRYRYVGGE